MHAGRLFLVDRGGQTQASIAVGEVGIDLLDPDSFALDVLGDIMNGFGGRLFDELRSKEVRAVAAWCLNFLMMSGQGGCSWRGLLSPLGFSHCSVIPGSRRLPTAVLKQLWH